MNKTFIELPKLTLKALFDYSVKEYAQRPFVQFVDEDALTYEDFAKEVQEVQNILVEYGINSGDKVALYSENMPNWSVVYFAVVTMGAVIVPILPDFHTSEALHIATHAGCKAAFISQKLFETMLNERQPQNLNLLVILDRLYILDKLSTSILSNTSSTLVLLTVVLSLPLPRLVLLVSLNVISSPLTILSATLIVACASYKAVCDD